MKPELVKTATTQNAEAEQSVLGGVLLDNRVLSELRLVLRPEDFFSERHRKIYTVMILLEDGGTPIDVVSLAHALGSDLERLGGNAALMDLGNYVPSAAGTLHHAAIVRDAALRRRLIQMADAVQRGASDGATAEEAIETAERLLTGVRDGRGIELVSTLDAVTLAIREEERNRKSGMELIGLSTSLRCLDKLTLGLIPGELTIVAARPGSGKTALAVAMATVNAAQGKNVLFITLEMTPMLLMMRALASASRQDFSKIRAGKLNSHGMNIVNSAASRLTQATPIQFLDSRGAGIEGVGIGTIASAARLQKRRGKLDLLIVDNLQVIATHRDRNSTHADQVGENVTRLRRLAEELAIPVVLLVQIRRAGEHGQQKIPTQNDLKDSGITEQAADNVVIIHPNVDADGEKSGEVVVRLAKGRNSATGQTQIRFDGPTLRFIEDFRTDDRAEQVY